jgi:circadian clock protein KaiC
MAMERVSTGVPGLDAVLGGGVPVGATLLVAGPPGTGKTVLAQQIAFHHAAEGGRVVYLTTLSETVDKLVRHGASLSWFDPARLGREITYLNIFDALQAEGPGAAAALAVRELRAAGATLLVMDGLRTIHDLTSPHEMRRFLVGLGGQLGFLGATAVLVGQYSADETDGFAEFAVVDGIVVLARKRAGTRTARTLEVAKLRGAGVIDGPHSFAIESDGITLFPRQTALVQAVPYEVGPDRLSIGDEGLDAAMGGGLLTGSLSLLAGTPGTGKTLLALQFLASARDRGERGLLITLDESRPHLERKAAVFGLADAGPFFDGARVQMLHAPAVELDPDALAAAVRGAVAQAVTCVVLDGVSALEATMSAAALAEYVVSLTSFLRGAGATTVMIQDELTLVGSPIHVGNAAFAASMDNVVLLRHVVVGNSLAIATLVAKVRDSAFDPALRYHAIGPAGYRLGEPVGPEASLATVAPVGAPHGAPRAGLA